MRFLKKTTTILLATSGLFTVAYSQDTTNTIGKVSIASPTAASLGKYGDIPVSYHTGIPNISIPVYTVESGSLKLPISLSYHASGLKVQEPASWVGAGWSLNAGGMITRTVVGGPDDKGYSSNLTTRGYYTDTGYCSYYSSQNDDSYMAKGYEDGEPDLYFFNFGGYSGKFYFNDDRTPMLVPEQDFKILPNLQTGNQGFAGFVVTTPDGTKYYFGSTGNYSSSVAPIEATNPITTQNGPSNTTAAASSWFLNKIVSSDGTDSITFSYVQESYSYYSQIWSPILGSKFNQTAPDGTLNGFNVAKNIVQGVRLTQITFKNGSITFTPSASARQDLSNSGGLLTGTTMVDHVNTNSYSLGSISIKNTNGFCKKDSLYYGYFYDNTALNSTYYGTAFAPDSLHTDEYRLRLDSIQETSCDNSLKVPPYKFTYFSESVPRRLSFAIDHWGYPNGQTSNPGLIPTFTITTSGTAQTTTLANRDASWPAMRGGSLQKITYPTGGYTQFDFEPKCIYTYNSSTLQQVNLTGFTLNMYGQSQITQTNSFTLNSDGACTIYVNNTCTNWQPTLTIYNSSSQLVYNSGYITTTLSTNLSLPAGNYTGTLAYPANATGLNGGATGQIGQYQYVSHNSTETVGGLRIKTITNNDGLTPNNIVTSFSYGGNSNSTGGTLYSIPTYVQVVRNDVNELIRPESCSPNGCLSCDGFNAHDYYISAAGNLHPMQTMQGENVGYNEVDVSQTGNGKTKYLYYNSDMWSTYPQDVCVRSIDQSSLCDQNIPNYPSVPLPFEFKRDELQSEMYFNQAGKLLKEVDHYPTYVYDSLTTPGIIEINIPGLYSHSDYQLQTAYKSQDKTITTTYDPANNNSLVTTSITYYGSPYHHQPTRTVTTTSTGDSLVTMAKYAMDFRVPSCDAIPDSLNYYYSKFHTDSTNMYSQLDTCHPQTDGIDNCRLTVYQLYRDTLAMDRKKFVTYRRRSYANDVSNLQSSCYLSAQTTADTLLKPVLRLQTMYDNAQIETSEWKNTNLLHASFIRYDTSTSPVGYADPGRTKLLNLQSPSATFTNAAVSSSTISKDSRYMDEDYYTFSNGNPQQVTGRDGVTNTFIWDYLNTEPIAKVSNAAQSQVAYTSFEADGKGGWNFSGTPVTDATSPTGSKCYTLSNGNITKSGLTSPKTIVSFWQKAGGTVHVTGGSNAFVAGKSINNWYYYEFTVTGASTITISGTGTIDELRLYPSNAQMTTYTYTPLLGMTSTCDPDNRITYYFYDNLGRLKWVKDQDLNIIKTIQYHYQTVTGLQY